MAEKFLTEKKGRAGQGRARLEMASGLWRLLLLGMAQEEPCLPPLTLQMPEFPPLGTLSAQGPLLFQGPLTTSFTVPPPRGHTVIMPMPPGQAA